MCSSGCKTQDHASWGDCVRGKSLQVEGVAAHHYNAGIRRQINEYVKVRKDGIQPASVYKQDVDKAVRISNETGVPYRADE